jgi:small subunit ribosomal protein S11
MAADKKDSKKNKTEVVKKSAPVKKKNKKVVTEGIVFVHASFNNTIINVTDNQGNSLAQHSSGAAGFSGSRKHTPFAAQVAAEKVATIAKEEFKMEKVEVRVKGPGPGRDSSVRALSMAGLEVTSILDETPIPHNGCRPSKRRRI